MHTIASDSTLVRPRAARRDVPLFIGTTFVASTLLFLVQPMFAKMVLPKLGGSPAVWNGCVLFFQTALLLGYLYAHLTTRWLGVRRQAALHVVVIAAALALLPISLGGADPPPDGSPVLWLLATMTLRLGLPFFAVSTIAPLVQRWFASLPVPSAANPYFLYAASNFGSMLALLAYPFVIEPLWGTRLQTRVWAGGYALLVILIASCALRVYRGGRELPPNVHSRRASWRERVRWTALAWIPSSLMLGVTTHISTDLASIPLLWVLPLALYLLTFIFAFSTRQWIPPRWAGRALPILVLGTLLSVILQLNAPLLIGLHLATFFAAALVCHTALAQCRPPVEGLTEFYVWMSVGGMLGGLFNTLLAPHLFTGVFEYPLVLALACLVRPAPQYRDGSEEPWGFIAAVAIVPLAMAAGLWATGFAPPDIGLPSVLITAAVVPMLVLAVANRRAPFNALAGLIVVSFIIVASTRSVRGDVVFAGRSFFGVSRVLEANDHSYRLLQHGTTLHGRQNLPAGTACEPQAYYDPAGPIGQFFKATGDRFHQVAVVGLGSGGMACYARPGSEWTFFEIDRLVERIARDTRLFTFLQNSRGNVRVRIVDGRKGLEAVPEASYDLVVLDAFSSDSVPIHLVTREAIELYMSRLRPGGALALHISNRYLDLEPVIAATIESRHLQALTNLELQVSAAEMERGRTASQWVVVADTPGPLEGVSALPGWRPLHARPGVRGWTDDYSNLLRTIRALW